MNEIIARTIKVEGMHCKSCEVLLRDILSEISGVLWVAADSKVGTVEIKAAHISALEVAKRAIAKEGYKVID